MSRFDRREFLVASGALLVAPTSSRAQKPARIGIVVSGVASAFATRVQALREGLRDLGYVEGSNLVFDIRSADGNMDRISTLATELVRLKVDLIVTHGGPAIQKVRQVAGTIPIVMGNSSDPVALGLAASLARPGGSVTGLSVIFPEITAKGMELLHETLPRVRRVAVLHVAGGSTGEALKETEARARALGIEIYADEVLAINDIDRAFSVLKKARAEALMVFDHNWFVSRDRHLAQLAIEQRLPSMFSQPEYVDVGGLMSYGARLADMWRRAAVYVDKILKGTKPGDIPIEQPTTFELVINLKTAKTLGITIPQSVLLRAARVIE